jgi:hypothetical protein
VGVEKAVELFLPYGRSLKGTPALTPPALDPTKQVSDELSFAFDFFNERLYGGRLRRCLVTLQRHRGCCGYFAGDRCESRDGCRLVSELALNIDTFHTMTVTEIFGVLVHEQAHAYQFQYGHPSPGGYHNKEFALFMERVGLVTSQTGAKDGPRTGVRMSHYIQADGPFARASAELIAQGIDVTFIDRWAAQAGKAGNGPVPDSKDQARRISKLTSKTRFECPVCEAKAWGNFNLLIDCRPCGQPMTPSKDSEKRHE